MERVMHWIRENPQLAGLAFACLILLFLAVVLGTSMSRAGVSMRPLIWFFGYFAIIAGPQAVVHLLDGLAIQKQRSSAVAAGAPAVAGLSPVAWEHVFGPGVDPDLITDPRRGLEAILGDAVEAKLSFQADGTSALAARFPSDVAASAALNRYGTFFAFAEVTGNEASGWTARRYGGQGEWNHVVAAGKELYAWTGPSRESVVANRTRALGPLFGSQELGEGGATAAVPTSPVGDKLRKRTGLMVALIALNLIAAVLWFFKGSAWVARSDANPGVQPVSAESLRRALLNLNGAEQPMQVDWVPGENTVTVTWRYADAKWFDFLRVHQIKRIHRMVLELDEPAHTVRVREYWSAFDGSAGPDGIRVAWNAATGIQFFAFEKVTVLGVPLGPDGRPTGEWMTGYTFNLPALKAPYLRTVNGAGWHWQPLVWNTPKALRAILEN